MKKYKGILNTPIPVNNSKVLLSNQTPFKSLANIAMEEIKPDIEARIKALYAHYNLEYIPKVNGHTLAIRIAQDHIKGFQIENELGAGRPKKWKGVLGLKFYSHIQMDLKKGADSLMHAIRNIKNELELSSTPETLNTRFNEICAEGIIPTQFNIALNLIKSQFPDLDEVSQISLLIKNIPTNTR